MAEKINKDVVLGKSTSLGAILSEEKIEEIAKKKSALGGDEEKIKNSLRNLRPKEKEIDLEEIPDDKAKLPIYYLGTYKVLNEEERNYYEKKWEEYTSEFEMNSSADMALLDIVIMEEIVYARTYKAQLSTPHQDLSKQMSESIKRHNDTLKQLGMSRTQRLGAKAGKEDNIASLVQQFDKEKMWELEKEAKSMEDEEAELVNKKKMDIMKELKEIDDAKVDGKDGREEVINPHVEAEALKMKAKPSKLKKELENIFDIAALK